MKYAVAIPVLLLLGSQSFGQTYNSYAFGKCYTFEITRAMLDKSPSWNGQTDNPPLSAGKAIHLATALKNRLVKDGLLKDPPDHEWLLMSARLENNWWGTKSERGRKWHWSVRFEAHVLVGGSSGIPNHLEIPVLMDGTVIEPKISDDRYGMSRPPRQ